MKRNRNSNRGFTLGEFALVLFVVFAVGYFIYSAFLQKKANETKDVEKPNYKSFTSKSGLVPLKVVTANPGEVDIYTNPDLASRSGKKVGFFETFFIFNKKDGFYQIGTDPFSEQTLGWIRKNDGILWDHREALQLKVNPHARPIYIWENKADIGHRRKVDYTQRLDNPRTIQYPMLEVNGENYKIALTWQTSTWDERGVATGWTSPIKTPQDATVVFYITRHELETSMEKLLTTLKELKNKPYSDHPIIQLFKEDLGLTFGQGLSLEDESLGFLKKVAGEAPRMPDVFKKLPGEVRGEFEKNWQTFMRLKNFLENQNNWDKRGGGWIPMELIPGN